MRLRRAGALVAGIGAILAIAFTLLPAAAHSAKLTAPTNLQGQVGPSSVNLTWNGVAGATSYQVDQRDTQIDVTSSTEYPVAPLSAGWYTFKVRAQASGERTSSPAVITVHVASGGPTPTPTSTGTPTPTPAPTGTPGTCSPGTFPTSYFSPDFEGPISRTFSEQFITDSGSYITTCYPAGSSAPSSGHPGGAQALLPITAGSADSYTLTYDLRFPVGFEFVKGGKLPGLCGGQCWTGSNNGAGGWSARFMWRTSGQAEVLLSDATTTGYGTDLGLGSWDWLADGQFHTLTEQVTMNTPGQPNGEITVTYNGVQVNQFTGLTLSASGDTEEIDSLMFTTFYGGHDSSWAPNSVQHIDFRNFAVG
jgi:hypothetical protein